MRWLSRRYRITSLAPGKRARYHQWDRRPNRDGRVLTSSFMAVRLRTTIKGIDLRQRDETYKNLVQSTAIGWNVTAEVCIVCTSADSRYCKVR
jgi:hypothetical protein